MTAPIPTRLVPVEPTAEMIRAGKHTLKGAVDFFEGEQARCVYVQMVAAAPPVTPAPAEQPSSYLTSAPADTGDTADAPVGQWRPIETAPKDGTEIILRRGARVTAGSWMTAREVCGSEFHSTTGEYLGEYPTGEVDDACWLSWDGGFTDEEPPTLWQPLPTATEAKK